MQLLSLVPPNIRLLAGIVSAAAKAIAAAAAQNDNNQDNPNTAVIVSPKHKLCPFSAPEYPAF
jgi:hypothetical protein